MLTTAGTMERYFPFRMIVGASINTIKMGIAGDYIQRMSAYEEFGTNQEFQDYHKAAIGGSLQPNETGRYWWQRNKYTAGAYFTRSQLRFNYTDKHLWRNRRNSNASSLGSPRVDVGSCRFRNARNSPK